MNIHVHIERLVLDGSLGLDSRALETAVIEGLSQALLLPPGLPLLQQSRHVEALRGGEIHLQGADTSLSEQLGRSICTALSSDSLPSYLPGLGGNINGVR